MSEVIERFLRYVKVDTQSCDGVEQFPSTEKQKDLARILVGELAQIGAANVRMDENGYVYATIPASDPDWTGRTIGFISHMDTSEAVSGRDVKPRIVEHYDGAEIPLDAEGKYVLSPAEYPDLLDNVGKDLIVTDGSTLLGADDKAGIAEIMAMASYLLSHPEVKHGRIQIAFTPDEEVGRGVDFFDLDGFDADFAYTVDGGALGEIEYENFNAQNLKIEIKGKSIHPGSAKGVMKNAVLIASELVQMIPPMENPACTDGYEGFYHVDSIEGDVEKVSMICLLRDHDKDKIRHKAAVMNGIAAFLNTKYGLGTGPITKYRGYENMKEKILPHMHLIDNAMLAMERAGVTAKICAIRGGTDGATLSYRGLPCPNLCTGGYNYHGRFEYIPVQSMEKMQEVLLNIVDIYAGN